MIILISVGLCFYDVIGFDGSEVVYVDNFVLSMGLILLFLGSCVDN